MVLAGIYSSEGAPGVTSGRRNVDVALPVGKKEISDGEVEGRNSEGEKQEIPDWLSLTPKKGKERSS